jgi:hypothetical protein
VTDVALVEALDMGKRSGYVSRGKGNSNTNTLVTRRDTQWGQPDWCCVARARDKKESPRDLHWRQAGRHSPQEYAGWWNMATTQSTWPDCRADWMSARAQVIMGPLELELTSKLFSTTTCTLPWVKLPCMTEANTDKCRREAHTEGTQASKVSLVTVEHVRPTKQELWEAELEPHGGKGKDIPVVGLGVRWYAYPSLTVLRHRKHAGEETEVRQDDMKAAFRWQRRHK